MISQREYGWYSGAVPPIPGTLEALLDAETALRAALGSEVVGLLLGQTGHDVHQVLNALCAGPESEHAGMSALDILTMLKSREVAMSVILKAQAAVVAGPYERTNNEEELAKQGVILGRYKALYDFLYNSFGNRDLSRFLAQGGGDVAGLGLNFICQFPSDPGAISQPDYMKLVVQELVKREILSQQSFWTYLLGRGWISESKTQEIKSLSIAFGMDTNQV